MRYFRKRMRSTRFLLVSAAVGIVVLAGAAVATATLAGYPTDSVTVMTGCLTNSGTGGGNIVNIAASPTTPSKACGSNQKLVHLSGGTITKITAGTGLTTTGSGGTGGSTGNGFIDNGFATLGLQPGYQLPQSCTSGQVAKSSGSNTWACTNDQNTTYDGTNFATSGQDCPAGQFATGIKADGTLNCAQPSVGDLQGSPCNVNGSSGGLHVGTDDTTGAVSLACWYKVSVTMTGVNDPFVQLESRSGGVFVHCSAPVSTCSALVAPGDEVAMSFESGDHANGGGTPFSYTCPGEPQETATATGSFFGGTFYSGGCPVTSPNYPWSLPLSANYAVTAIPSG